MTSSLTTQPLHPNSIAWGKQGEGDTLKQAQKEAWSAAFRTQLQEIDYEIKAIEGKLPDALNGTTIIRNGHGRSERGTGPNAQRVSH